VFGLYLHIPFCRSKCSYCDFYSLVDADGALLQAYPALLRHQLQLAAADWQGPLASVFFGGGTPSLLPAREIAEILATAEHCFGFSPQIEISLEANPGTVTLEELVELHSAGINRLSLGAQATDDESLAALGRSHTHVETLAAVAAARSAGFANLGLDLIYGRPGPSRLEDDLDRLLALEPQHLSCYALTVEAGTPLAREEAAGRFVAAPEERVAEEYHRLHERLTTAGYEHYEISNFARPGYACRHNRAYWERHAYLGLGAGAHSFRAAGWGERLAVPADLEGYRRRLASGADPAVSLEVFDRSGAMSETLYLGLRTAAGVSEAAFAERFGVGVAAAFPAAMARCGERLRLVDGCWRFDLDGWLLYDHLIAHFL